MLIVYLHVLGIVEINATSVKIQEVDQEQEQVVEVRDRVAEEIV